jgi:hypothetical protein
VRKIALKTKGKKDLTILKIADVPAVFMLKIQKKICAHVAAEGNGSSVTQVYVCVRYITKKNALVAAEGNGKSAAQVYVCAGKCLRNFKMNEHNALVAAEGNGRSAAQVYVCAGKNLSF